MADIKFGLSEINRPAPAAYRNFSNAMIIFLIPGAIALISGWGLKPQIANHWLMGLGFLPAAIKAIGVLLGNGQYYMNPDKPTEQPKQP